MSPVSKAQQKAVHNYVRNNYDRIEVTLKPKGREERGETLNSFINRAIDETIERDNKEPPEKE